MRGGFFLGMAAGVVVGGGIASGVWWWAREARESRVRAESATPAAREDGAVVPSPSSRGPEPAPAARVAALERVNRGLRHEAEGLRKRLDAVTQAADQGTSPIAAENRALRQELARARAALRNEESARREQEGASIPFPKDLDDAYRQDALLRAMNDAIQKARMQGEVKSVDCSEYPCMLYGDFKAASAADLEAQMRRTEAELAKSYPEERNRFMTSLWASRNPEKEGSKAMFGVAVLPKDGAGVDQAELTRRMRFRSNQYMDSVRPK
jgi:hypothetical protein